MTNVTIIKHPNTNEEILRDLRGRSINTQHQEWIKQGCVLFTQSVLTACLACGVGIGLAHSEILDHPAEVSAAILKEVI